MGAGMRTDGTLIALLFLVILGLYEAKKLLFFCYKRSDACVGKFCLVGMMILRGLIAFGGSLSP